MKKKHIILIILFIILTCIITIPLVYFNIYYHAENIEEYLKSTDNVKISKEEYGYKYDGPGEIAFIFYPGAKVEETAYAPLMYKLAENGIDCFLIKMPFRFAIFNSNAADKVIKSNSYETYNIGGHSLGGAFASIYAYKNPNNISNVILLGSYSTKNLTKKNLKTLFIYGSNDKIINKDKLEDSKKLLKEYEELIIEGGNHANFAYYGPQKGDGKESITKDEQIEITVNKITDYLVKEK